MNLSFESITLIGALTLSGYFIYLCATPPNPNPTKSDVKDRISLATDTRKPSKYLLSFVWLNRTLLILFPDKRSNFCLNADLLNENLFSWSRTSIIFLLVILIAAPLRLLAYAQLGKNFTFRLDKPQNLVTDGLYAYVQHPSYTALFFVNVASFLFTFRLDGVAACYLPSLLVRTKGLSEVAGLVASVVMTMGMWVRVKDEEAMLKKEFGQEWIEYHRKTKRFIPGIF